VSSTPGEQVVSLARVDVAVNVDVPAFDFAMAAVKLNLEQVLLTNIDRLGLSAFTVHPSATGPACLPSYNSYVIAREDGALWEAIGAGDLTAEHMAALPAGSLDVRRGPEDDVARAQVRGGTLIERTCAQFGENRYAALSASAMSPSAKTAHPGSDTRSTASTASITLYQHICPG